MVVKIAMMMMMVMMVVVVMRRGGQHVNILRQSLLRLHLGHVQVNHLFFIALAINGCIQVIASF